MDVRLGTTTVAIFHPGRRVALHTRTSRPHPEMGYRSCLGIIRLGDRYGRDRLESACTRALAIPTIALRRRNGRGIGDTRSN